MWTSQMFVTNSMGKLSHQKWKIQDSWLALELKNWTRIAPGLFASCFGMNAQRLNFTEFVIDGKFWRSFPNSIVFSTREFFHQIWALILSERSLISVGLYYLETQIDRNKKQTNERQKVFDKIYRKGMEYSRNLKAKR